MTTLLFLLAVIGGFGALAYFAAPLWAWTAGLGLVVALASLQLPEFLVAVLWLLWLSVALANITLVRRYLYSAPLLRLYRHKLPAMSTTEREALEAGNVWWDAELFSGRPEWQRLLELPKPSLTPEEQAFLDGPVDKLCRRIDDWQITYELHDLPPDIWEFVKAHRFLGMIIPKDYGGLGFSAQAHSAVVAKVASRSGSTAVTVMVPNSLGPAELLMHYGTEAQKNYYLPRLAEGREIPCFALTSPYAGSDASAIPDRGVVCQGEYQGQSVLGIRVTWEKRYITLAPVATVLGLAFQLYDPEHLVGTKDNVGITLALIPTNHPGVRIGRRHFPLKLAFQNGPTAGEDVFIPMDMVIGGRERLGQGWRMLMQRLAVGRSISLPALAAAAVKYCARYAGAYARVRKQFKLPIGRFEGIEERLAHIAAEAYAVESARRITAVALDHGQEPAVVSAILKYQATERQRRVVNDAMDILGGRAICEGPSNYMANMYQGVPVSITVEGANILTRSLIVFGQGAIRCHPWLYKEIQAALESDQQAGLAAFDEALAGHLGFLLRNLAQAFVHNLTRARSVTTPEAGPAGRWYAELGRLSASFALSADIALLLLGGELKRREHLSGRFADILAEMYFLSCVLKRFEDEGRQAGDRPLVESIGAAAVAIIEQRLAEILANFPSRPLGWLLRRIVFPWGRQSRPADDRLTHQTAALLLEASPARDRLTAGIFVSRAPDDITGRIEHAFEMVPNAESIEARIKAAIKSGAIKVTDEHSARAEALNAGIVSAEDMQLLEAWDRAVRAAIDVNDFAPEALAPLAQAARG